MEWAISFLIGERITSSGMDLNNESAIHLLPLIFAFLDIPSIWNWQTSIYFRNEILFVTKMATKFHIVIAYVHYFVRVL